jgi:hypothetical protein
MPTLDDLFDWGLESAAQVGVHGGICWYVGKGRGGVGGRSLGESSPGGWVALQLSNMGESYCEVVIGQDAKMRTLVNASRRRLVNAKRRRLVNAKMRRLDNTKRRRLDNAKRRRLDNAKRRRLDNAKR